MCPVVVFKERLVTIKPFALVAIAWEALTVLTIGYKVVTQRNSDIVVE